MSNVAISQGNEYRKTDPLSDATLRDYAQNLVNSFKVAVIKSVKCKTKANFSLESILQKFTYDAKIEISNLRDSTKKRYSPEVYFGILRRLCSGINYDDINIRFDPDPITNEQIIRFNNSCIVKKDINQRFEGYKNGVLAYCDVTIKEIKMVFVPQTDGSYKGLISYISAKSTKNCMLDQ
jgi:hypothetical protein